MNAKNKMNAKNNDLRTQKAIWVEEIVLCQCCYKKKKKIDIPDNSYFYQLGIK